MAKRQRTDGPGPGDPGAEFMRAVQDQDRVTLGQQPHTTATRQNESRSQTLPRVPVRIGWERPARTSLRNDSAGEEEEDAPPRGCPTTCPIPRCPDTFVRRSRKALVSHMAAKHVANGERVPPEVLQSLGVRLCKDPCRTLVPITAPCRNCRRVAGSNGPEQEPQPAPMPLLAPVQTPPPPGTPVTLPCPPLAPTFEEVFAAQVSTVRHIPAMCRASIADELANLVKDVALPIPTWEALHRLMCFPKLVLLSSQRGGKKHQHQVAHVMVCRLQRFRAGQFAPLWAETLKQAQRDAPSSMRTRQQSRQEEEDELPASDVGRIRTLVEEGALSKATKQLLPTGLADSRDPRVQRALVDLHPPSQPHLAPRDDLPVEVVSNVAIEGDEDAEVAEWTKRAQEAITSFPPGSAGGPSGLRPVHLRECCRKPSHGLQLAHALGQLARIAARQAFPAPMSEVLCASSLIPLQKKDGGLRPIAVGDTIRRVLGKCLLSLAAVKKELSSLQPRQCGVGVRNAAEMVGMGLQRYVQSREAAGDRDYVVLQVDVKNAFNSMSRDAILRGCMAKAPSVYNWLRFCYGKPSPLFCQGRLLCMSAVGVHQGDTCGPLGFALGLDTAPD